MVFFTCNACGASLKKNQVEKHYQNECRNCEVLSCMDCGQDFHGDDYASHTKCISEAEKYQGAMYKETGKKQEEWLEKAREAIQNAKVSSRISTLLRRISEYSNIPRKKKKFENFVRNSCNVRDQQTLDELWTVFNTQPQSIPVSEVTPIQEELLNSKDNGKTKEEMEQIAKKQKKKKKKNLNIEVEMNSNDSVGGAGVVEGVGLVEKKRKKKRERDESESGLEEIINGQTAEAKKSKKRKQHLDEAVDTVGVRKKKVKVTEGISRKRTNHKI